MSAWSMNDGSALTGTHTFTNASAAVSASSGAYTTEVAVGDILVTAGGESVRVKSITDDDNLTLTDNFGATTESGVAATVRRPPINFDSAAPHIDSTILGVDTTELSAGGDNVVSVTVSNQGSGYASAPAVSFSGGGGSSAAGTAVLTDNKVTSVTVTNVGSSYTSAPTATAAAPSEVTFNAASAVDGTDITLTSHPFETGDAVTYSDKSGTAIAELTDGGTFFIVKVDANTVQLATTALNASAGTVLTLTDGPSENHGLTGETATLVAALGAGGTEVTHAGWVKKTVGTGGRAGRVFYETLVASSTISGDAADDLELPDS